MQFRPAALLHSFTLESQLIKFLTTKYLPSRTVFVLQRGCLHGDKLSIGLYNRFRPSQPRHYFPLEYPPQWVVYSLFSAVNPN